MGVGVRRGGYEKGGECKRGGGMGLCGNEERGKEGVCGNEERVR